MKKLASIPIPEHIPPLSINTGGLNRHSLACMFFPEPALSAEDLKLRSWLLHTVRSAARHYSKALELVQKQNSHDQLQSGGLAFFVLDVKEQLEGCISATFRICRALKRIKTSESATEFCNTNDEAIKQLEKIRNQFEHMHQQITSNETGNGPISINYNNEGKVIKFRKLKMETKQLHSLIEGAFHVVSTYFPTFNPNSTPESDTPVMLTMSLDVTIVPKK